MIGRLTGTPIGEEPKGTLVFDVGGVGYELFTPAGTLGKLKPNEAGRCVVFVHTHLRSDALELYGFAHEAERELFRLLINVPNVFVASCRSAIISSV